MTSLFAEQPFYHATVKKLIVAFGTLFSGMTISRADANGDFIKVLKIPLEYAPKNKWLSLIREQASNTDKINITLPRMAFEITDYRYDAARKVGTQGTGVMGTLGDTRTKLYNPVPWDVIINLYSMTKTQEEALQILEQILPYFAPTMTLNVNLLPQFNIVKEIPLLLQGVAVEDSFEGTPQDFRNVIQTFTFAAQLDFFGPINLKTAMIKTAIADLSTSLDPQNEVAGPTSPEHADVYTAEVIPPTANKTDPHTVEEEWVLKGF